MLQKKNEFLISCEALESEFGNLNLRIIDCSWHLSSEDRNPRVEYESEHIPNSLFLDLHSVSDQTNQLPHMAPSAEQFSKEISCLGIRNDNKIVVYDSQGMFSAARIWWLFRLFGKDDVMILNGGLPKWKALRKPLTEEKIVRADEVFFTHYEENIISNFDDVKTAIKSSTQIIDARSSERFMGLSPEPRRGLKAGNIPSSKNIFYGDLLNGDKTFKGKAEIRRIFETAGVDVNKLIITSCGSGVTAAILFFALEYIGARKLSLYDGSWCEWGSALNLEKTKG